MQTQRKDGLTCASAFSGPGGADIGLIRAGFTPIWFAEVDAHASAVLRYRHPGVPNYGDVTTIDEDELEAPYLFWMSPPCQDLSVAGRRAGLEGERSGLFYDGIRIAKSLIRRGTRYVCMEQVPGLFSSAGGDDFRRVLREFWQLGPIDLGWRVLDSQYANVAQRRERAFFVLDFGGRSAAEILSFAEGMSGHPAPRRKAGEGVVASLTAGSNPNSNAAGRRREDDVNIVPAVAQCISAQPQLRHCPSLDTYIPDVCATLAAPGGGANDSSRLGAVIPIKEVTANQWSKDSCGHGIGNDGDPSYCLGAANPNGVAVINARQDPVTSEDVTHPLDTDGSSQAVFQIQWASGGGQVQNDTAQAQRAGAEASYQFLQGGFGVRRLTPRECERLQGWPDDWTRWGDYGKGVVEISDTQRYRMTGNGVTATISEIIGRKALEALAIP